MPVMNGNKLGLDAQNWEQLPFAPAIGRAGTSICDDRVRYIYVMFAASATVAQFWRFDTWYQSWQQLASPPTTTITVGKILYTESIGSQWSGHCFGSVFSFQANGTTCYWYKYNVATNTWASALSVSGLPAAFATDAYVCYPDVARNNYDGAYHSGVTRTITTSATAAPGATTVSVSALPQALAANTVLDFGLVSITTTAAAARGATTISVSAISNDIAAYAALRSPDGLDVWLASTASAGATSLTVFPLSKAISSGSVLTIRQKAAMTAAASAGATSITVSALLVSLASSENAYYYDNMYLIGRGAAVMYRYAIATNAWATTSANSGNPAIPAIPAAPGLGSFIKWLPAYAPDKLWILRGGATSTKYLYDLVTNSFSTETYYPATETFTTGTWAASREINGKLASLVIQKDTTMRFYEGIPTNNRLEARGTQWQYATSTAVVGDRATCITTPDGVEFMYCLMHSSTAFLRVPFLDQ